MPARSLALGRSHLSYQAGRIGDHLGTLLEVMVNVIRSAEMVDMPNLLCFHETAAAVSGTLSLPDAMALAVGMRVGFPSLLSLPKR